MNKNYILIPWLNITMNTNLIMTQKKNYRYKQKNLNINWNKDKIFVKVQNHQNHNQKQSEINEEDKERAGTEITGITEMIQHHPYHHEVVLDPDPQGVKERMIMWFKERWTGRWFKVGLWHDEEEESN